MIEDWRASVNGLKHANVISYAEKNSYNVTKFLIKEVFFGGESGRGGGGCKVIRRIVRTSEKILATPLSTSASRSLKGLDNKPITVKRPIP